MQLFFLHSLFTQFKTNLISCRTFLSTLSIFHILLSTFNNTLAGRLPVPANSMFFKMIHHPGNYIYDSDLI